MKILHLICISCLLSISSQVKAQLVNNLIDSSYITPVESTWRVGMHIGTFQDIREFQHTNGEIEHELSTTIEPTIGILLKYKNWPTLKLSTPTASTEESTEAKTKGFRFSLHSSPVQSILIDVYYNRLKGYNYINLFNLDEETRAYDEIRARNFAINTFYILNSDRYSNKHAFDMGQNQLQNAGSWMLGAALNLTYQKKTERLFDNSNSDEDLLEFSRIRGLQFAALGGYSHNWLMGMKKRGFISFGIFMGPNYHVGKVSYLDLDSRDFSGIDYTARFQFSVGHKSKRNTHLVFKVLGSFYGYSLPDVDLINRLVDGDLSFVKYFGNVSK